MEWCGWKRMGKSSKHQHPSSREAPNFKHQEDGLVLTGDGCSRWEKLLETVGVSFRRGAITTG